MQEQEFLLKFIFKSESFDVPARIDLWSSMNQQIAMELLKNHQYEFQSRVSLEVFQSFIKYWNTNIFPDEELTINNIQEFELLNEEIQLKQLKTILDTKESHIDRKLANIYGLQKMNISDKSNIEKEIAMHLDDYITKYGDELISSPIQSLYNIFNHSQRTITKFDLSFNLINNYYKKTKDTNILILLPSLEFGQLNQGNQHEIIYLSNLLKIQLPKIDIVQLIDTIEDQQKKIKNLQEINELLLINQEYNTDQYIKSKIDSIKILSEYMDVEELRLLTLTKYKVNNGLEYFLNQKNQTAELLISSDYSGDLVVPNSIEYRKDKYKIISIRKRKSNISNISSITFSNDCEIQSIGKYLFNCSQINCITIPESVSELKKGWCKGIKSGTKIIISPKNKTFKMIEDKFIVGKKKTKDIISQKELYYDYSCDNDEYDCYDENNIYFENINEDDGEDKYEILYFYQGNSNEIIIPDYISEISSYCFCSNESLISIKFTPNSKLINICKSAFKYSSIKSIIIPKHVRQMSDRAFKSSEIETIEFEPESEFTHIVQSMFYYSSIKSIVIPKHVKQIGNSAFKNSFLETIEFEPESELTDICESAFEYCTIKSIIIPKHVKQIGNFAFRCSHLETIEFEPESKLVFIGEEAFNSCQIKKIIIPKHVKQICNRAFKNCLSLEKIEFEPDSELVFIGKIIIGCCPIESISIPKHVKEIYRYAFYYSNLKTIKFSADSELKIIEKHAFQNSSIESISIPKHVTHIKYCAFDSCKSLKTVEFSSDSELKIIGEWAFGVSSIESISIPKHVTHIELSAFDSCNKLEKITFSDDCKIQSIGKSVFNGSQINCITIPESVSELKNGWCKGIKSSTKIIISPKNKTFKMIEDKFIVGKKQNNKDEGEDKYEILYFYQGNSNEIIIPDYISEISSYCFCSNESLISIKFTPNSKLINICKSAFKYSSIKSIIIPKHVRQIGDRAFKSSEIETIEFEPESELTNIGKSAFVNSGIKSIIIPKHVKQIDDYAFYETNLETIEFAPESELEYIGKESFKRCKIKNIIIPKNVKKIDVEAFNSNLLETVEFESDSELEYIGEQSFKNCKIKNIIIPKNVRKIDDDAFFGNKLESIDFEKDSKLTYIGRCAFETHLVKSIIFPKYVNHIGYSVGGDELNVEFAPDSEIIHIGRFHSIKSIIIPKHVKQIDPKAFLKCYKLKTVEFVNDSELTIICEEAFSYTAIESISIPKSVKQIDDKAFYNCTNLKSVIVPHDNKLYYIGSNVFGNSPLTRIKSIGDLVNLQKNLQE